MLEKVSDNHVTNWVRVAALLDVNFTSEDTSIFTYTPEMSWFLPPEILLGELEYLPTYLLKLGFFSSFFLLEQMFKLSIS